MSSWNRAFQEFIFTSLQMQDICRIWSQVRRFLIYWRKKVRNFICFVMYLLVNCKSNTNKKAKCRCAYLYIIMIICVCFWERKSRSKTRCCRWFICMWMCHLSIYNWDHLYYRLWMWFSISDGLRNVSIVKVMVITNPDAISE